jgi:hypothetical protein
MFEIALAYLSISFLFLVLNLKDIDDHRKSITSVRSREQKVQLGMKLDRDLLETKMFLLWPVLFARQIMSLVEAIKSKK